MTELVYQTDKHDWYVISWYDSRIGYGHGDRWSPMKHIIYNIVPTGSPPPTSGYYSTRWIMDAKGYGELKVHNTFLNTKG